MRKMKFFVVVCAVFFSLLNVNKSDGQESVLPNVLNIIVILDTSNRTRHPGQIERDITIIKAIVTQFEKIVREHLRVSELIQYPHRLKFVVPEQPNVRYPDHNQIIDNFTIEDSGNGRSWPEFMAQKQQLLLAIPRLYKHVELHEQTGSDIWGWFKSEAKDSLSRDQRNLIICLSDGYLNFNRNIEANRIPRTFMRVRELRDDPNWRERIHGSEGLLSIGDKFSDYNVKFLMVEITIQCDSSGAPYQKDFEIITEYWKTWLNLMRIEGSDFKKRVSIPIETIQSFISNEDRP